jgi:hypothetical protein
MGNQIIITVQDATDLNKGVSTLPNIPVDPLPLVFLSAAQALSTNTAYVFTQGDFEYELPSVSARNDLLELKLQGANSYTIAQGADQSITVGENTTTVGTSGSIKCNGSGDWIRLKCTEANKTWIEFGVSGSSFIIT